MDMYFAGVHTLYMGNSGNFQITRAGAGITFGAFGAGNVSINPHPVPSTVTYILPQTDGSANHVLTTNGSGAMSWTAPSTMSEGKAIAFAMIFG
jgi:hypothetical protein